jgi:TonB family protein
MRERLVVSVFLAILVHFILLLVLQLMLKLERPRIPEYTGPLYVTLGETPEEAPVIEKAEEPRQLPPMKREQPRVEQSSAEPGGAASGPPLLRPVPTPETQPAAPSRSPLTFLGEAQKPSSNESYLPPEQEAYQSPPAQAQTSPQPVPAQQAPVPEETPVMPEEESDQALLLEGEMQRLDQSLSQSGQSGARSGSQEGGPAAQPATGVQSTSAQEGRDYEIEWEDSSQGRDPTDMPQPKIPDWVSKQGLRLQVVISFELTSQGVLRNVKVERSSGYTEVDNVVRDALIHWRFPPVASNTGTVTGRITYTIIPR